MSENLDQFLTDFKVKVETWESDAPPLSRWSGAKFSVLPKKNKGKASQKSRDLQGYLAESARLQLRVMASISVTGRAYRVAEQKTREMNESTLTTNGQNNVKERGKTYLQPLGNRVTFMNTSDEASFTQMLMDKFNVTSGI